MSNSHRQQEREEAARLRKITAKKEIRFIGKALTVAQPWAAAIAFGGKDIENRGVRTHYRGPVAIHAGSTFYEDDLEIPKRRYRGGEKRTIARQIMLGRRYYDHFGEDDALIQGHFVAIAMLVDCVERSSSPWYADGNFGWVLEGAMPIQPVPAKGKLGLWDCKFTYSPLPRC